MGSATRALGSFTTRPESIGDSGCVLAQRPGMDVRASSLGGTVGGKRYMVQ